MNIPNLVVVRAGPDGNVALYNDQGSVHVIFDVVGWYGQNGDSYNPVTPARVLDTRNGTGGPAGRVGAGQTRSVTVAGGAACRPPARQRSSSTSPPSPRRREAS